MLDKNPFQVDRFGGINRGSESTQFGLEYQDTVPLSDALDCENLMFTRDGGLQTRPLVKRNKISLEKLLQLKIIALGLDNIGRLED